MEESRGRGAGFVLRVAGDIRRGGLVVLRRGGEVRVPAAVTQAAWAALVVLLNACGQVPEPAPGQEASAEVAKPGPLDLTVGDAAAVGFDPEALSAIDGYLQGLVEDGVVPGASLMLARGGQVAHVTTVGWSDAERQRPVTPTSIFRLASATKILVSVAFMTLVEEGRVALSDPVSKYVPEFGTLMGPDGQSLPGATLTILDLLRHTGGLGYGYADPYQQALVDAGLLTLGGVHGMDWSHGMTLEAWAGRLAGVPLEDEPGKAFSYGLGHDLLGLVVERATGQRLDAFVDERLVEPLGLTGTGFVVPAGRSNDLTSFYLAENDSLRLLERSEESPFHRRPEAPSGGGGWDQLGNGGMVSTLGDFGRVLQMLNDGGQAGGLQFLEPESVESMRRNQLDGLEDITSFWPGAGFGMGYAVLFDPTVHEAPGSAGKIWWAGSTNVYFWLDPARDLTGVFMTHVLPFGQGDVMAEVERMAYAAADAAGG